MVEWLRKITELWPSSPQVLESQAACSIINCEHQMPLNVYQHLRALLSEVKKKLHDDGKDRTNEDGKSNKDWPYDEILFCFLFSVPDTTWCHVLITCYSASSWISPTLSNVLSLFLPCKFRRVFCQLDKVLSLELLFAWTLGGSEHLAQPKQRGHGSNEDQDQSLPGPWAIPEV